MLTSMKNLIYFFSVCFCKKGIRLIAKIIFLSQTRVFEWRSFYCLCWNLNFRAEYTLTHKEESSQLYPSTIPTSLYLLNVFHVKEAERQVCSLVWDKKKKKKEITRGRTNCRQNERGRKWKSVWWCQIRQKAQSWCVLVCRTKSSDRLAVPAMLTINTHTCAAASVHTNY